MIIHYLKIAFRNMWKYKIQTLISLIGLAVGFTCFALATLWIRYEMTFDSFHPNAKHKYVVYIPSSNQVGYSTTTPPPLAAYLKETFPEIANAMRIDPNIRGDGRRESRITAEGIEFSTLFLQADSSIFKMFDVKIIDGSREFLIPDSRKVAITQEKARQLFGNENPIGKTVNTGREDLTICAVVSNMPKRSNFAFDFIEPLNNIAVRVIGDSNPNPNLIWRSAIGNTIIELLPGTNVEAFEKKLYEHDAGEERGSISKMKMIPLTKLRYADPNIVREVEFQHICIFAVSGFLVILCSLFNYLTLFVTRFRIRQKELALRVVCGASGGSLLAMLSVEFMLMLLFAVVLGCVLTHWSYQPFLTLSDIKMDLPAIYLELLMYVGGVILIALMVFWLILVVFRRRSLNVSIRQSNKTLFRKASVVVQLIISIGFAFCTTVILKQMYFLHHSGELGFSFKNSGSIVVYGEDNDEILANRLKQIPEITEALVAKRLTTLIPEGGRSRQNVDSWDNKPTDAQDISLEQMYVSPEYISFYDLKLLAGEMLTDTDPETMVMLNENVVKAFGWHDPVGKQFDDNYTVKGVIKHVYNFAPTIAAMPVIYLKPPQDRITSVAVRNGEIIFGGTVLFKYGEGMWKSCKEKIEQQFKDEIDSFNLFMYNAEEEYNNYLKSENSLIRLLSFVSAVCVLICVFGFVSLVSLTCEERRKSIAIRKINGATAGDILAMFAREYSLLLIIGAAMAFPAGFVIMQRWLEHYAIQTNIPAWIYLSILFVMALVIVLCVGWQVYKTSIENPAEVVKME